MKWVAVPEEALTLFLVSIAVASRLCTAQNAANFLPMYVDELPQVPKIYGYASHEDSPRPVKLTVGMFQTTWKFHRDLPKTTVFAFGTSKKTASIPGPIIEALQGVPLEVTWENHLPAAHIIPLDPSIPIPHPTHGGVPTVTHLHGGIHEPQSDGSPMSWFTNDFRDKGPKWTKSTYYYPNIQQPGNHWYHDHAMGVTRLNVLVGLFGGYILRSPLVEKPFGLPSGDEFDRMLIIADRSFSKDGSLYVNMTGVDPSVHPHWQPEYFGDAILVNGKAWPYLKVQRRKYRFRIINASNARYLRLSLSNGLKFTVIGSDASYLPAPVTSATLVLAPAEIFDVVLDFSNSNTSEAELTNDAPSPYPAGKAASLSNSKVMKFIISSSSKGTPDHSKIPSRLVNYATASVKEATLKRYITFYEYFSPSSGQPTHLYINGKRYVDPATEFPKVGSTEVWDVINLTTDDHPLHIHLAEFQVIAMRGLANATALKNCMVEKNDEAKCGIARQVTGNSIPVPRYEKTWKNVVKVPPGNVTTVVVKFRRVDTNEPYPFDATAEPGYVYHCHILEHEDNEMMRPMKLVSI